MRAFLVTEWAHHGQIPLATDVPEPTCQPGQVLVDIYSAGLNFFEILQVQGKHQSKPPLPFILGNEFAGKISACSPIPEGCPFKPGERVFGGWLGAFAEKIAVPWEKILPLPDHMSFDEGAGLYVTWPTSYEALVGRAELKPGEWVLVTASAGGVGIAAVQLAKALGAKVIGAAGSETKRKVTRELGGADYTVDYTKPGWQKEIMDITAGHGVDVIYDPVGMIRDCLKCIAWKGRAVVIGFAGGKIENLPLNVVLVKNVSVVGLHWGAYATHEPEHIPVVWKALLNAFATGYIKPVVYEKIFPLESVAKGLDAIASRQTWGKPIVKIREDTHGPEAKL